MDTLFRLPEQQQQEQTQHAQESEPILPDGGDSHQPEFDFGDYHPSVPGAD